MLHLNEACEDTYFVDPSKPFNGYEEFFKEDKKIKQSKIRECFGLINLTLRSEKF